MCRIALLGVALWWGPHAAFGADYFAATGSYYEFVADPMSWSAAKAAAELRSYQGLPGHLVAITSEPEEQFVESIAPRGSMGWLGAEADGAAWKWSGGPESGVLLADGLQWRGHWSHSFAAWEEPLEWDEPYPRYAALERPHSDRWAGWWDLPGDGSVSGYWVEYSTRPNPVYVPSTGHYLQFVPAAGISWQEAYTAAESEEFLGVRGHLATVASFAEQGFLRRQYANVDSAWFGASDRDGSGYWQWLGDPSEQDVFWVGGDAGTPLGFNAWKAGAPSSPLDAPAYAVWLGENSGEWAALGRDDASSVHGYFVEFSVPTLPPTSLNRRPVFNGHNGHYYQAFQLQGDGPAIWDRADAVASSLSYRGIPGHLATITSHEEAVFLDRNFQDVANGAWLGASDADLEGEWRWVAGPDTGTVLYRDGHPVGFGDWADQEPNNVGDEDFIGWNWFGGFWNDTPGWLGGSLFLVEYSPLPGDTDSDGDIDLDDFGTLAAHFGETDATFQSGDFDLNSRVDLADLALLKAMFHRTAAVPEPDSLNLLAIGVLIASLVWRRRAQNEAGPRAATVPRPNLVRPLRRFIFAATVSLMLLGDLPRAAIAEPVRNAANGNYYEFVPDPDMPWTTAKGFAEERSFAGLNGHLATITSPEEQAFLQSLTNGASLGWLGATDAGARGEWRWTTGPETDAQITQYWPGLNWIHSISYTNWVDDPFAQQGDRYLAFEATQSGKRMGWLDLQGEDHVSGYWVEYSSGPQAIFSNDMRTYYQYVPAHGIGWEAAAAAADSMTYGGASGHLATVATFSESEFLRRQFQDVGAAWIGARGTPSGGWRWAGASAENDLFWAGGHAVGYHNWADGGPAVSHADAFAVWRGGNDAEWTAATDTSDLVDGFLVEFDVSPPRLRTSEIIYNSLNGHAYQYVSRIDPRESPVWTRSEYAAGTAFLEGRRGHLVTITSAEEQEFLLDQLEKLSFQSVWIAASDAEQEGEWQWVAGPETGSVFWKDGATIGYSDWPSGEPNDASGEDYAVWQPGGHWNDLFGAGGAGRFIVEYSLIAGDANDDGVVDLDDFGVVRQHFGSGHQLSEGDLNLDGNVDLDDFGILKQNFGVAPAAVPEPAGWLPMAVGILSLIGARRRLG